MIAKPVIPMSFNFEESLPGRLDPKQNMDLQETPSPGYNKKMLQSQ